MARSSIALARRSVGAGIVVSFLLALVWVALTNRTGLTYHFFPLAIAAAAPLLPRLLFEARLTAGEVALAAVAGVAAVGLGWAGLVALDAVPDATFVADQPGGVPAEAAAFALLGAAFGTWWTRR